MNAGSRWRRDSENLCDCEGNGPLVDMIAQAIVYQIWMKMAFVMQTKFWLHVDIASILTLQQPAMMGPVSGAAVHSVKGMIWLPQTASVLLRQLDLC